METNSRPGRFEKRRKVRPPRRILTVLIDGAMYRRDQGRLKCDGRWRRYLDVPNDDHEWPGTEGCTIVYERPDDPVELPKLSPQELAARKRLLMRIGQQQQAGRAEMEAWKERR